MHTGPVLPVQSIVEVAELAASDVSRGAVVGSRHNSRHDVGGARGAEACDACLGSYRSNFKDFGHLGKLAVQGLQRDAMCGSMSRSLAQ